MIRGMEGLQKELTRSSKRKADRAATPRKISRVKAKGGKEVLKYKEKDGQEHKRTWDFFPRRRPHHKQGSSKCHLVHS